MTAKTKVGKTFPGITKYAMQECKEARVLAAEGVRSDSAAHMAADFDFQRSRRPGLGNAVLHVAISLPPEESIGRTREQVGETLRQSGVAWLKEMKIENTQWGLIQHFDRHHSHAHLIINRVDNDGKTISDKFIGKRSREAAQAVERQLGLISAEQRGREHAKQAGPTPSQQKARTPKEVRQADWQRTRHEVANALAPQRGKVGSFDDLQAKVVWDGIVVKPLQHKKVDGPVVYGVVFSKNGFDFKGSEVGKDFSAGNLQKSFAEYRAQAPAQKDAAQQLGAAFTAGALGQLFADGAKQAKEKQQATAPKQPAVQVTQAPVLPQKDFEFGS
nr:relaxase/mobilization nuclease domain-containing protein [Hymenobacter psoromatis]